MSKRSFSFKAGIVVISVVVFSALICLLSPSILLIGTSQGRQSLFDKHFCAVESPDHQQRIDVYRRVGFPVNEIIDPSGVVTVELSRSDGAQKSTSFQIDEYSDVTIPSVLWNDNGAIISNIEHGRNHTIELSYSK